MKFQVTNPKVWEAVCKEDMPMKDIMYFLTHLILML